MDNHGDYGSDVCLWGYYLFLSWDTDHLCVSRINGIFLIFHAWYFHPTTETD
jgi:hypothetical protein